MTSAAEHHGAMTLDRADTREGAYARIPTELAAGIMSRPFTRSQPLGARNEAAHFPIILLRGVPLLRSARGSRWYSLPQAPEISLPAHRLRWRADGRAILAPLWRAAAMYRFHSR